MKTDHTPMLDIANKAEIINDPIYIVGMARSGTTLIARILSRNKNVHILNETHILRELGDRINHRSYFQRENYNDLMKFTNQFLTIQSKDYYRKNEYEEFPEESKAVLDRYFFNSGSCADFIKTLFSDQWLRNGKKWGGDQTPNDIFNIDVILNLFPNAKIIYVTRDPRAVLFSQKNKWKAGLAKGLPKFEIFRTIVNYHPVTQSMLWRKSVAAFECANEKYSRTNLHAIKFEELVCKPSQVVNDLCKFLELYFSTDMLDVNVSMSSSRISSSPYGGIDKKISSNWQGKLTRTEIFIAESLCGKKASKFGYEMINPEPNYFLYFFFMMLLPLQLIMVSLMNLQRIKNPVAYFFKLIRITHKNQA